MRGVVLSKAVYIGLRNPKNVCEQHIRWYSSSTIAKVFLVRHGQTHANRDRLIDGQTDSVLTDLGRQQAVAAGIALKDVHFGLAVSSDLPRATATAELLLGQNTANDWGRLETCNLLRERHFGTLDRVPTVEYMAHPEFDGWGGEFTPKGAETREEVRGRASHFFLTLVGRISKRRAGVGEHLNCLIVSHGVVIMELIRYLAREFNCSFPNRATEVLHENKVAPNASITTLYIGVGTSKRGQSALSAVQDVECLNLYCDQHLRCFGTN